MISWMQKHKKYLVITIWISTIAFVGAGFVGWGAYKYGAGSDAIAEVGETKVTVKEFQQRYATVYNYYNKMLQGKLDQAQAKKLGLDKMVLNQLIQEALLENYAKDLGLRVSDEEVAQKIASMQVFWQNGRFSPELYHKILAQNRIKPKDFENGIKKELLLNKLKKALGIEIFPLEFDTVASALFMGDKIEYKILSSNDIHVSVTEDELKKYYESHKFDYKTALKYIVALIELPITDKTIEEKILKKFYMEHKLNYKDKNGKILSFEQAKEQVKSNYLAKMTKKEALKRYIEFKKGKISAQKEITVEKGSTTLPQKLLQKLATATPTKVFKPVLSGNKYIIAKLVKKIPPHPMSFNQAKEMVKKDYLAAKTKEELLKRAKKELTSFNGVKTDGYITKFDIDKLHELSPKEAQTFLEKLFLSQKDKGIIPLGDTRVILYRILDQKLAVTPQIRKNKALISNNSRNLKDTIQNSNLIKKLQSLYEIKVYKGL